MKRVIIIIVILGLVGGIVAILASNKKKIDEKNTQNVVQTVFPVKVTTVSERTINDKLSLVGTVIANADITVSSETTGRIIKRYVEVGQYVSAGTTLFDVDNEIRTTQLRIAEANFEKAKRDSSRIRYLVDEKSMAASQWDGVELQYKLAEQQLIQARRALNDTRIKAPISGFITTRNGDVGMNLGINTPVCTIVDISRVKVRLNVAEDDVFKLKNGDRVTISSDALHNETFSGTITAIGVKADDAHTYPVEVTVGNTGKLKAGMFARVNFTQTTNGKALVIPREAVVGSINDAQVFVVRGTTARLQKVKLGNDVEGNIEVLGGLNGGEQVITTGLNTVKDGATVTVAQ
ncbi:MAG: efflux RND transporter periplasmic adaptor subunit [Candidatus Kapabacteria bacterium]|nr:efflux RND transporter periplasmic adaptor subunit [Candidatus Kapabacteria bacterium]